MTFEPIIPMWLVWSAVILALVVVVYAYRTPSLRMIFRIVAILIIGLMLANPVREISEPVTRTPHLVVVTDTSLSMATTDEENDASRYAVARAIAAQFGKELFGHYQVSQLAFSNKLHAAVPVKATGDSDFSSLSDLQAQAPKPTAVIVISDGADWKHTDPDSVLARARITAHTIGVGDSRPATNLSVRLDVASPTVFPGQELPMTAIISATPDLRGQRVRMQVDSIDESGRPTALLSRDVDLDALVRIPVVDTPSGKKGGRLWRVRVAVQPGETTSDDNEDFASAQLVDRNVRVLVVEGQPNWDTAFAVRAWRRDRQLDVATLYALGAKRQWRAGNGAPERLDAEALQGVDVVVIGNDIDSLCTHDTPAVLRTYVERGGAIVFLGTQPRLAGALDSLAPLTARSPLQSINIKSDDRAIDGLLPAGKDVTVVGITDGKLASHSQVLLGTRQRPLIASRHMGGGWVCSIGVQQIWSWSFAESGREASERFWRQLLRHLTNAPTGQLRAERLRMGVGEEAVVWVDPNAGSAPVRVRRPDGSRVELAVQDDVVRLKLPMSGLYRFDQNNETVTIVASDNNREQLERARDDARLQRLAHATGGEFLTRDTIDGLITRLKKTRTLAGKVTRSKPMITEVWWFLLLLLLLSVEWFERRRRGMV